MQRFPVERMAESVEHLPEERRPDRHLVRSSGGDDPGVVGDAGRGTQGRQEDVLLVETDHLGQHVFSPSAASSAPLEEAESPRFAPR